MNTNPFVIANDVCSFCEPPPKDMWEKLQKQFPDIIGQYAPANHPAWEVWKEWFEPYNKKCLTYEYDDSGVSVCEEHLEQLLTALKEHV